MLEKESLASEAILIWSSSEMLNQYLIAFYDANARYSASSSKVTHEEFTATYGRNVRIKGLGNVSRHDKLA